MTVAGLESAGLKRYALAKAKEMLTKGVSSCGVGFYGLSCDMAPYGNCYINNSGGVGCNDDGGQGWSVYTDGSAGIHSAP